MTCVCSGSYINTSILSVYGPLTKLRPKHDDRITELPFSNTFSWKNCLNFNQDFAEFSLWDSIYKNPALVEVIILHWTGNKLLPVIKVVHFICVARPQWVKSSPPGQNGCCFADVVFKSISLNEKAQILIKISLKFVRKGPINNIPAMVLIMAWLRPSDNPLSEPMLTQFTDAYMQH